MIVKFWYKNPADRTAYKTRATSRGLTVDGVNYTWKEVESKWGISGRRFSKRWHSNPDWTMEELLTRPIQAHRKDANRRTIKSSAGERKNQKQRMEHLPEQLWANEVAYLRWR